MPEQRYTTSGRAVEEWFPNEALRVCADNDDERRSNGINDDDDDDDDDELDDVDVGDIKGDVPAVAHDDGDDDDDDS